MWSADEDEIISTHMSCGTKFEAGRLGYMPGPWYDLVKQLLPSRTINAIIKRAHRLRKAAEDKHREVEIPGAKEDSNTYEDDEEEDEWADDGEESQRAVQARARPAPPPPLQQRRVVSAQRLNSDTTQTSDASPLLPDGTERWRTPPLPQPPQPPMQPLQPSTLMQLPPPGLPPSAASAAAPPVPEAPRKHSAKALGKRPIGSY